MLLLRSSLKTEEKPQNHFQLRYITHFRKQHTTNYQNTLIEVAADCPVGKAEILPIKGTTQTVANIQFEMISKNPYKFTSDEVLFQVFAQKKCPLYLYENPSLLIWMQFGKS
jgi:hypothetical protein